MAQEKKLATNKMTSTAKATGPELWTISTIALLGTADGAEGAMASSWKKSIARASGEAKPGKIIASIVRRCERLSGRGEPLLVRAKWCWGGGGPPPGSCGETVWNESVSGGVSRHSIDSIMVAAKIVKSKGLSDKKSPGSIAEASCLSKVIPL